MVVFPPVSVLRERRSAKWSSYDPDVLPMPVAEMDCELAPPVAEALHDAVRRSDTGYPAMDGALAAAFGGFAERRWGWQVDPGQVTPTGDVSVGAVQVLRAATAPGGTCVLSSPVYPPFHRWPGSVGLHLVDVPMLLDETPTPSYRLDLEGLEAAFAAGASAYLLCSPHNPLGHVYPPAELAALAELAARYDVLVIADEIHAPLTLPGSTFTPYLTVSDAARRTGVALHSASKAWNLAGLKSAVIVTADDGIRRGKLDRLPPDVPWHAGHFGAIASIAAYEEGEEWLDDLIRVIAGNHVLLADELARELPQAKIVRARAGYLAWVDLRECGFGDAADPAEAILRVGRLALGIGTQFGTTGRGHVRVNVGCAPDLIPEAVRRIVAAKDHAGD